MDTLTLKRPDNFHVHLRDGNMLRQVAPATARVYGRAMVMPNTEKPILKAADAIAYRDRILAATDEAGISGFTPLMTIKLTHDTRPETIADAMGVAVAGKMYPEGQTTGSHGGISDFMAPDLIDVLKAMRDAGMVLSIHAELPGAPMMRAEELFIPVIEDYLELVPGLKIVVEHVSSRAMAYFVADGPATLAATVTPQHLWHTIDDVLGGVDPAGGGRGLMPHRFCYPVPKTEADRSALWGMLARGSQKFFAGDDSAPHLLHRKESSCGRPGVYCAPCSLQTYAEVFDRLRALDRLENFASRFGAEFYGLPPNAGRVVLVRDDAEDPLPERQFVTGKGDSVMLWRGGEHLPWRIESVSGGGA